jgi:Zn-dependent hydrolases, including glyoxylases
MKALVLGKVQTNCYIISNGDTKEAIVIDPADNADRIEQYLRANDLVCEDILLTHGHFDHIMAAEELAKQLPAKIYASAAEAELLKKPELNASSRTGRECSVAADILLQDEQVLVLAGFTIKVIHTPGHTVGGVCYYLPDQKVLISGDTLFCDSIGRSDLPTGNGSLLVASIQSKLMPLEDTVKVFPGHGTSTTIGYERENNIYL